MIETLLKPTHTPCTSYQLKSYTLGVVKVSLVIQLSADHTSDRVSGESTCIVLYCTTHYLEHSPGAVSGTLTDDSLEHLPVAESGTLTGGRVWNLHQ